MFNRKLLSQSDCKQEQGLEKKFTSFKKEYFRFQKTIKKDQKKLKTICAVNYKP